MGEKLYTSKCPTHGTSCSFADEQIPAKRELSKIRRSRDKRIIVEEIETIVFEEVAPQWISVDIKISHDSEEEEEMNNTNNNEANISNNTVWSEPMELVSPSSHEKVKCINGHTHTIPLNYAYLYTSDDMCSDGPAGISYNIELRNNTIRVTKEVFEAVECQILK